mgnify:CR=1 FL=1
MYEIFERLCKEKGVTAYRVCKETGLTTATISNWKAGRYTPKQEKMQKIADYFGVSLVYLMTGKDEKPPEPQLTPRDKRDIAKDLESIMQKLSDKENRPASYNGQDLSPESTDLFKEELEIALKRLKIINKEKYNPNKNKK